MNIEILPLQKGRTSRVRPPHQMRVGNVNEPQAGGDVTKALTERQTATLQRHSGTITPLRLRHVDDDGRNEEEAPDNATTDDED